MAEPLFFDCLTDAQIWSLFETGVLQSYRLPVEVYERLRRLASDHGCTLFTWPGGMEPPALQDIIAGLGTSLGATLAQLPDRYLETYLSREAIDSAIARLCACSPGVGPSGDQQIHALVTTPHIELRAGPFLAPQDRDLHSMSLLEIEAYLDEVLRLDEDYEADSTDSAIQ